MGLRDLQLKYQYRPSEGNIVDDFYLPCLSESVLYQRAVGYFTSTSLALAARGLSRFITAGDGRMQLVASPVLTPADREAIKLGYEARVDIVTRSLLRELKPTVDDIVNRRLGFLAWLIAHERLEIKIALISDIDRPGIYHEKIGIFQDKDGNVVAFSGSSNETEGGLYLNFESLEVFCSWREGDAIRVENKVRDFAALWYNTTPYLEVIEFPKAAKEGLLEYSRYYKSGDPDPESEVEKARLWLLNKVAPPPELRLRDYQAEAIRAWAQNGGSGILEMATGTGKTLTALTAAAKLLEKAGRLGLFIVVPYKHLADQWADEARRFGLRPLMAYISRELWEQQLVSTLTSFQMEVINHYSVITTTATFQSEPMQMLLRRAAPPTMLIADEVHHLGASHLRNSLPENIPYRLGLSATPDRWLDDEGSKALRSYFAPGVVFRYGLKEAIQAGFLTRYFYHPHVVELTEDESEEYRTISRQIARLAGGRPALDLEDPRLQKLLIARARILSRAENKLHRLKELVWPLRDSQYNLFYCGDGKIEGRRQIALVTEMLGREIGMKIHPFTSEETPEERQELLKQFAAGKLQGLVAIRCLDEGVDVPATQTAYILASSTNPREFIQRRGRILRRHPGKKWATIHDFIVIPRNIADVRHLEPEVFNLERQLVRRELYRVIEFAGLAENGPQAHAALQPLKKVYHLLDM